MVGRGSGAAFWARKLSHYFLTQMTVTTVNMATGLLIVWLLGVPEYAIYVLCSSLISALTLLSDFGTAQGVVSLGAPRRDANGTEKVFIAGFRIRRVMFFCLAPLSLAVMLPVLHVTTQSWVPAIILAGLVLVTVWLQQGVALRTSLFNARHDSSALARAGIFSAGSRAVLVAALCSAHPHAWLALTINAVAQLACDLFLKRAEPDLTVARNSDTAEERRALRKFILPLVPGVLYLAFQSNISTFILALGNATVSVAEVGALARLGQLVGALSLFNGFFIQPYFSRLPNRQLFVKRLGQASTLLLMVFALMLASTIAYPSWWLAILGPQYVGLESELPIAILIAQCTVAGAFLYTVVISRGDTRGQLWQIPVGLAVQIPFLYVHGIHTTSDALYFNAIPAACYVLLQAFILAQMIRRWH